jgi:hypothetical protein
VYPKKIIVVAVALKDTWVAVREGLGVKNRMPMARQRLKSSKQKSLFMSIRDHMDRHKLSRAIESTSKVRT